MRLNHFNFRELDDQYMLTNDFGRFVFLAKEDFKALVSKSLDPESSVAAELQDLGFIYNGTDMSFVDEFMYCQRDAKSYLASATSLHIFVVNTTCNMNCVYCQANNGRSVPGSIMTEELAERSVDIALQSPEKRLSFEFQGGEPLLNFQVIRHIVEYTEEQKGDHCIEYSIVTNLSLITDEILDFFEEYSFGISTSIDGTEMIHDTNRPAKTGGSSYRAAVEGIKKVRNRGLYIGAIQTTTRYSLAYPKEIVDAYLELGFDSIFIRHLTRLGKAGKAWETIGYEAEEFLEFYRKAIDSMISYNKKGIKIREQHASIFLKRIFGGRLNYMELRSPCGGGTGQMAYYSDGRVFTCDEGRMLAEMGDDSFYLGDVRIDTYADMIKSSVCRTVCRSSVLETLPSCCDCVYQPFCGTCPVVNYALTGDVIEKSPNSFRCKVYKGILEYLFDLIRKADTETMDILERWGE